MITFRTLAGLTAALALTGAATAQTLVTATGVIRHDVPVNAVDPVSSQKPNRRTGVPNQHLVLAPEKPADRKGRLFLFIVGSGISETTTKEIVYEGVHRGYHSIAIAYPNYDAVAVLCARAPDPDCTGKVREEILTGADLSPLVTVAPQDALEPRLKNLLIYLRDKYPTEGWDKFLKGGDIDWSTVSAAGHSQGAGHVALLAKRHALYRALMISGVADQTEAGKPAPWLSRPNLTPPERQFGLTSTNDNVVTLAVADASWNAIGLKTFGVPQSVDNQAPPYAGSHKLITSKPQASGVNPHVAMVDDATMSRDANGTPFYKPAWDFAALP